MSEIDNTINRNLYNDLPYVPARDLREVNAVDRLEQLRHQSQVRVFDDDVQEGDLRVALENQEKSLDGEYIRVGQKGVAGGVAPLNESGVIDDDYLPTTSTGIATLSLAGIAEAPIVGRTAILPVTTDTCAGLFSCEEKAKLDSIDLSTLATKQELNQKTDKKIIGTNGTAEIFNEKDGGGSYFAHNDGTVSFIGVADEGASGINAQIYAKNKRTNIGSRLDVKTDGIYYTVGNQSAAERDVPANKLATIGDLANKQNTITDLEAIRSGAALGATAIQSHQDISGKLNKLPLVDDPTDPGYGWPYHIPYNVKFNMGTDKATVTLQTLTLDNNVTKMDFSQDIPSATATSAGLMSSVDKQKLDDIAPSKLESSLTVSTAVGGVTAGTVFPAGTSLLYILTQILSGSTPPAPTADQIYYGITNSIPSMATLNNPNTSAHEHVDISDVDTSTTSYNHGYNNGESDDPQYFSFAYPSSLGDLTSILDEMNAQQINNFTKITDNGYNIYYIGDQWCESDMHFTFSF